MSPLVALVLIGFLFVIALCLTVWAALSLAATPRRGEEREEVTYVPLSREPDTRVWRAGGSTSRAPAAAAAPAAGGFGGSVVPTVPRTTVTARVKGRAATGSEPEAEPGAGQAQRRASNDDHRGARAKVTQRPNLDDAFERFLDHERKDR